jgi:transcriptional regulator of heat shock response
MNNSSLVFTPIKKNGHTVGVIGVLGPRRMNYKQVLQTLGDIGGSISLMMDEDKQLPHGNAKEGDSDGGN